MTLRSLKRAVRAGDWKMEPVGEITAASEAQRRRLIEAVTAARLYLEGSQNTAEMGKALGVTQERVAQIVSLGVRHMQAEGWLHPKDAGLSTRGQELP